MTKKTHDWLVEITNKVTGEHKRCIFTAKDETGLRRCVRTSEGESWKVVTAQPINQ